MPLRIYISDRITGRKASLSPRVQFILRRLSAWNSFPIGRSGSLFRGPYRKEQSHVSSAIRHVLFIATRDDGSSNPYQTPPLTRRYPIRPRCHPLPFVETAATPASVRLLSPVLASLQPVSALRDLAGHED